MQQQVLAMAETLLPQIISTRDSGERQIEWKDFCSIFFFKQCHIPVSQALLWMSVMHLWQWDKDTTVSPEGCRQWPLSLPGQKIQHLTDAWSSLQQGDTVQTGYLLY